MRSRVFKLKSISISNVLCPILFTPYLIFLTIIIHQRFSVLLLSFITEIKAVAPHSSRQLKKRVEFKAFQDEYFEIIWEINTEREMLFSNNTRFGRIWRILNGLLVLPK